jgi:hypothetical protein
VHPFFLASSGEAAVWFIFSLKGCAFLYLLIHKIRLYLLELLNQADAPKKFDQNRQAPKGSHCTQGVADFDLPTPKSGLNSCQSFCSGTSKECFCTTHSLISAWNRTRLIYLGLNSDFGLKAEMA